VDLGFFRGFAGSPCQYLSSIALQFADPCPLVFLEEVLPRLPNLGQLRVTKALLEMAVGEVNGVLGALGKHCPLAEVFWLSNIRVEGVAVEVLRTLFEECPFLSEL
jgi:hypothetical protein